MRFYSKNNYGMKTLKTLYELVKNSVETFASRTAFVMLGGEEVTYEEVESKVRRMEK